MGDGMGCADLTSLETYHQRRIYAKGMGDGMRKPHIVGNLPSTTDRSPFYGKPRRKGISKFAEVLRVLCEAANQSHSSRTQKYTTQALYS